MGNIVWKIDLLESDAVLDDDDWNLMLLNGIDLELGERYLVGNDVELENIDWGLVEIDRILVMFVMFVRDTVMHHWMEVVVNDLNIVENWNYKSLMVIRMMVVLLKFVDFPDTNRDSSDRHCIPDGGELVDFDIRHDERLAVCRLFETLFASLTTSVRWKNFFYCKNDFKRFYKTDFNLRKLNFIILTVSIF